MLEAQLLNTRASETRDKLQSAQSTLRGAKRGGLGAVPRGDVTRLSANSHRSSTERELRTSERSVAGEPPDLQVAVPTARGANASAAR